MRIGLAYNEKPDRSTTDEPPGTSDAFAEWDDPSTIAAVEEALGLFGSVTRLEADEFFPQKLALAHPDLVFNMAEGLHGQNRESLVPAICEYFTIPYTAPTRSPSRCRCTRGAPRNCSPTAGCRRRRSCASNGRRTWRACRSPIRCSSSRCARGRGRASSSTTCVRLRRSCGSGC